MSGGAARAFAGRPEHEHGEPSGDYPHVQAAHEALVYVPPAEYAERLACFSGARRPGEKPACDRPAALYVYGQAYCGVHGAEIRAGALVELYRHAALDLERVGSSEYGAATDNRAAVWALSEAVAVLDARCEEAEREEDEALLAAWPFDEALMDEDFRQYAEGTTPSRKGSPPRAGAGSTGS
jgi:hypothetical protein